MNIVADSKPLLVCGGSTSGSDIASEPVLGVLNLVGGVLVVVISINVEVGNVITKLCHIVLTSRGSCAAGIRGAHVCREESEDIAKSCLILPHLLLAVVGANGGQVEMGPGVRGDLMAFSLHALDDRDEFGSSIDLSLVDIVATDEEGCLCIVGFEDVQDMRSEGWVRSVIVGDGHGSWDGALINSSSSILNGTKLWSSNIGGAGSSRGYIFRAGRAIGVHASRRVAVIWSSSAPTTRAATFSSSTVSLSRTTFSLCLLGVGLVGAADSSITSLQVGQQVPRLKVLDVQAEHLRGAGNISMGLDERKGDRSRGQSSREVHVDRDQVILIL